LPFLQPDTVWHRKVDRTPGHLHAFFNAHRITLVLRKKIVVCQSREIRLPRIDFAQSSPTTQGMNLDASTVPSSAMLPCKKYFA
jgi:hypothetical protein